MSVTSYPLVDEIDFHEKRFDAFGRLRTSNPQTLFDSKLIFDKQSLFWDESLVTGAGIVSTHSTDEAGVTLTSTLNTAGKFVRQTFQCFNYQAGKSQLVYMTGNLVKSGGGVGIKTCMGQYNDDNGIFLMYDEGVPTAVQRSSVTGSPVDTEVIQSNWDDPLDGSGESGVTIDWGKEIILKIDYGWLGSAPTRMGILTNTGTVYFFTFENANALTGVFISTPNLQLRYEMITQATSAASTMGITCATVITEGGSQEIGVIRSFSTTSNPAATTHDIRANVANTAYVVCGVRLKSTCFGATIQITAASILATTNDNFEWLILLNPTLANAATFTDEPNACVQIAIGNSSNPSNTSITALGTLLQCGFGAAKISESGLVENTLHLGAAIDNTADEIYLAVRPLTANARVHGSMTIRELT